MNAYQVIRILFARGWVVLGLLVLTVGTTAAISYLLPRTYTASAALVIEPRLTDVTGQVPLAAPAMAQTYIATQIDVIKSQRVALRVVERLGIDKSAAAAAQFAEATGGTGSISAYFAGLLVKRLDVKPSRESAVVTLTVSAADPQFAAQVANAFAEAYMEVAVELRNAPARQNAGWFSEQIKALRADLERAQTRLSAFQQRNGIVANDERLDVENQRLAELSQQLVIAQSQRAEARARERNGDPSVESVPEVASSPILQALRADYSRAVSKLREAEQSLGAAHPTLRQRVAEVRSLERRIDEELLSSALSVASNNRAVSQRTNEIDESLRAQKERVLEIKRQRDEMAVLQREAESAQRVYDLALQRFAQTSLESQATQTNSYLLARAAAPSLPSSPRVKLNLVLSAVLGTILGVGAALLMEVLDRRVRAASDLSNGARLQVLGVLPPARVRRITGKRAQLPGPAAAQPEAA
jgi:chain length determinant protein EpsF